MEGSENMVWSGNLPNSREDFRLASLPCHLSLIQQPRINVSVVISLYIPVYTWVFCFQKMWFCDLYYFATQVFLFYFFKRWCFRKELNSVLLVTVMAQSYLMRVREALVAQDPACFKRFLYILNDFTENPDRSPIQLYNQLCEVSLPSIFCNIHILWITKGTTLFWLFMTKSSGISLSLCRFCLIFHIYWKSLWHFCCPSKPLHLGSMHNTVPSTEWGTSWKSWR